MPADQTPIQPSTGSNIPPSAPKAITTCWKAAVAAAPAAIPFIGIAINERSGFLEYRQPTTQF